MNHPQDIIEDLAFTELLTTCQMPGCQSLLLQSAEEPATDPVDEWSERMAKLARDADWAVDASGRVLCTMHNRLWRNTTYNDE